MDSTSPNRNEYNINGYNILFYLLPLSDTINVLRRVLKAVYPSDGDPHMTSVLTIIQCTGISSTAFERLLTSALTQLLAAKPMYKCKVHSYWLLLVAIC